MVFHSGLRKIKEKGENRISNLLLTCTILEMSIGNMDRGKRRMLNRDSETKAISASKTLFSSTNTKTAKVTKATYFFSQIEKEKEKIPRVSK